MIKWGILLYILLATALYAQSSPNSISGFITDKFTGKPLQNVNIFVSGINNGSVSDKIGYYEIRGLPEGQYKLTFSLIGYESISLLLEISGQEIPRQEIKLTPRTYSTETIEVSSNRFIDRHKVIELFKELFLGQTEYSDSCSFINEESIVISDLSNQSFIIKCDTELVIKNNALGYLICGKLLNTSLDFSSHNLSYSFYPVFNEITAKDKAQYSFWQENRSAAFKGTLRHFLRSLYNCRLNEDGYQLYLKKQENSQLEKIDDIKIILAAGNDGKFILKTNGVLYVKYGLDISTIRLRLPFITIDDKGNIAEKSSVELTGAFSSRSLSKQLPADFLPESPKKIKNISLHDEIEQFLDSIKDIKANIFEAYKDSVKLLSLKYPANTLLKLKYSALLERCCSSTAESVLWDITEMDSMNSEAYFRLGLLKAKEFNDFKGSIKKVINEFEQETLSNNMKISGEGIRIPEGESNSFSFNELNMEIFEEAARLLQKAILSNPEIDDYYITLASLYEDSKKYDSAIEVINKLLNKNNTYKDAHLFLGMLFYRTKNYGQSKHEFDLAMSFMTAGEKDDFIFNSVKMLLDPVIGKRFPSMDELSLSEVIKKFWDAEDPLLLTSYNERLLEHYARVAYAKLRFTPKSGKMPGWNTERGEILLRYGFPKEIIRYRPFNTMDRNNMMEIKSKTDVWFYDDMVFSFYDPYMSDEFRLSSGIESKVRSQFEIDSKLFSDNLKKRQFERYTFRPEGTPLNYYYNTYQFKDLSDIKSAKTDIYCALSACNCDAADFKKDLYWWGLNFFDLKLNKLSASKDLLRVVNKDNILPAVDKNNIVFVKSEKIQPQSVRVASEVLRESDKGSFSSHKQISVKDFSSDKSLMLSDIILSSKVIFGSGSSSAINRNGIWILPKPENKFSSNDSVHIYFEIYNLSSDSLGINDLEQEIKAASIAESEGNFLGKMANGLLDFFKPDENGKLSSAETRMISHSRNQQSCLETSFSHFKSGKYSLFIKVTDKLTGQTAESRTDFIIE